MITRAARVRSGITLTEILISIMIMAIGLISLATLFPIGLVRLRDAQRQSRSALLAESAFADMQSRKLLDPATFSESFYGFNPFLIDTNNINLIANYQTGVAPLPVCYDPLWFAVTGYPPYSPTSAAIASNVNVFPAGSFQGGPVFARFGQAVGTVGAAGGDNGTTSSAGLQRISNFAPWTAAVSSFPFTYANPNGVNPPNFRDMVVDTFVSPEDIVMQNDSPNQMVLQVNPNAPQAASGVVPMMGANGLPFTDWRFSWFFTGRQIDQSNDTQFAGDIVIVENRQIGYEPGSGLASSEFAVEAIFGAGGNNAFGTTWFFASGASRSVLLRWPANSIPDLEIKVGSWFADVTYDLTGLKGPSNSAGGTNYPMQRCNWYQVAKRSDVQTVGNYRQMTLTTATPLKAQTLLSAPNTPVFANTAVFMPGVINVFPRTFYVR